MKFYKLALSFLIFGLNCFSQSILIDVGSSTHTGLYNADQDYSGGLISNTSANGSNIYKTLRYGLNFEYNITVPDGTYLVQLIFSEPTYTTPNQRLFTYTINGLTSPVVDIIQRVGKIHKPLVVFNETTTNGTGNIKITFKSIKGNAILSAIRIIYAWPDYLDYCNSTKYIKNNITYTSDWYCIGLTGQVE